MFVNSFWNALSPDVSRAWLFMERLLWRASPQPPPLSSSKRTLYPTPALSLYDSLFFILFVSNGNVETVFVSLFIFSSRI